MALDASTRKPTVFVLMPFADDFLPVYERLIKTPLEEIGFEVRRADSDWHQRSVLRDFVVGIVSADLVIADVTGLNSNVMYELGLAHALGARTITISRDLTELPFDLQPYRAHEYSTEFHLAHQLSDALVSIGNALVAGEAEFGNPIQDFSPDALRVEAPVLHPFAGGDFNVSDARDTGSPDPDPPDGKSNASKPKTDESDSRPGFLEASVEIQQIAERLNEISTEIGNRTESVGNSFEAHSARIAEVQRRLGQKSPGAVLAIANEMAAELDDFCADLAPRSDDFAKLIVSFNAAVEVVAREVVIEDEEDLAAARDSIESTRGLEQAFEQNAASVREFAATMERMPNASKKLRQSGKRTAGVVNRLAERIEEAAAETTRIRGITESRVQAYEDRR